MSSSSTLPRSRRTTSSRASSVSSPDRRAIFACRPPLQVGQPLRRHPPDDRRLSAGEPTDLAVADVRGRGHIERADLAVAGVGGEEGVGAGEGVGGQGAGLGGGLRRAVWPPSGGAARGPLGRRRRGWPGARRVLRLARRGCGAGSSASACRRWPVGQRGRLLGAGSAECSSPARLRLACRSAVRTTTARAAASRAPAQPRDRPRRGQRNLGRSGRRSGGRRQVEERGTVLFSGRGGAGTGPHLGPDRVHLFPGVPEPERPPSPDAPRDIGQVPATRRSSPPLPVAGSRSPPAVAGSRCSRQACLRWSASQDSVLGEDLHGEAAAPAAAPVRPSARRNLANSPCGSMATWHELVRRSSPSSPLTRSPASSEAGGEAVPVGRPDHS